MRVREGAAARPPAPLTSATAATAASAACSAAAAAMLKQQQIPLLQLPQMQLQLKPEGLVL